MKRIMIWQSLSNGWFAIMRSPQLAGNLVSCSLQKDTQSTRTHTHTPLFTSLSLSTSPLSVSILSFVLILCKVAPPEYSHIQNMT